MKKMKKMKRMKEGMENNYLDGIDIIYWINLDRSTDRKNRMLKMFSDDSFNNIPIKRFSAVDGKNENIQEMITSRKRKLTNPEYGCLLSHLEIINEFSKGDYDVALILEDDITLDFKKYWRKSVRDVIKNAPSDWEIIMLCYHSDINPVNEYTLNENNYWSTGAYIINNAAAKRMTNITYYDGTYHLDDNTKQAADDYLFIKMKTYVYKYPYFMYGYSENTTIPTSNVKYHNYSRKKIEYLYETQYINETEYTGSSIYRDDGIIENFSNYTPMIANNNFYIHIFLIFISLFVCLLMVFFSFMTLFTLPITTKKLKRMFSDFI
jgi:hypothetical protein